MAQWLERSTDIAGGSEFDSPRWTVCFKVKTRFSSTSEPIEDQHNARFDNSLLTE